MTFKKASLAAYGVAAVVAASSMGMQVEAASLSKVLPAAGIGLTLSDGTALSQIKEASTKSANIAIDIEKLVSGKDLSNTKKVSLNKKRKCI